MSTATIPRPTVPPFVEYLQAGLSVIPIRADGSKASTFAWKPYMTNRATIQEGEQWARRFKGLAVIGGAVSGNLELIDIDEPGLVSPFLEYVEAQNVVLFAKLCQIRTPRRDDSGRPGWHVVYRCEAKISGNTILAQSKPEPVFNEKGEPDIDPNTGKQKMKPRTLIETRGEGGYFLVPGCSPQCHETGNLYEHVAGPKITELATLTNAEHELLFWAARIFDYSAVMTCEEPEVGEHDRNGDGESPGDAFNRRAIWAEILEPHGWQCVRESGDIKLWRHPGKAKGWSATTGKRSKSGNELFVNFSSNAHPFESTNSTGRPGASYSKFAAFAFLNHGGDFREAAKDLAGRGYGESTPRRNGNGQVTTNGQRASKPSGELVLTCMADVEPLALEWLWPNRIPLGKTSQIAGDPGLGKSLIALDIAARVSRGLPWPDALHTSIIAGSVILVTAEDDPADTIRPRLDAAGADTSRVFILQGMRAVDPETKTTYVRPFSLADLMMLTKSLERVKDCRLVVIDPVSAYLGAVDSHKNAEVRSALAPLGELAQRHRVAILLISHLNKGGGPAMYRSMGSLAFVAAVRTAWGVVKDKDNPNRRLVVCIKNNLGLDSGGLAYSIFATRENVPLLAWEDKVLSITADEAMLRDDRDQAELREALHWLREVLADGPVCAAELEKSARAGGPAWGTIRRAKLDLKVVSYREGFGRGGIWYWKLPSEIEAKEV